MKSILDSSHLDFHVLHVAALISLVKAIRKRSIVSVPVNDKPVKMVT